MFKKAIIASIVTLAACPAQAENPYAKPDDSWVSISGTVASSGANSFMLDYGDGLVTVEVDDWDSWGEAYGLIEGDEVTVYGAVDDDLFEMTKIEASSIYVEDLNTYFYASAADEEGASVWTTYAPIDLNHVTLSGTVNSVDPKDETFTINSGAKKVTIEVDELFYNPLDEMGFQKVEKGDVVSVTGEIYQTFFNDLVLDANSVVTLLDNS